MKKTVELFIYFEFHQLIKSKSFPLLFYNYSTLGQYAD